MLDLNEMALKRMRSSGAEAAQMVVECYAAPRRQHSNAPPNNNVMHKPRSS
jgi:hypothetical protein